MEEFEKITVITVVYNAAGDIEETIRSVIGQNYPGIEYIVIDGGSKDGTVDIIKKYEEKIQYWVSEPDKGIYDAMNKGIDKATGNWINFMNAGDFFYSEDAVSNVFAPDKTGKYTGYSVVYGDAEFRLRNFSYTKIAMESTYDRFMPFSHQAAFVRAEIAKKFRFDTSYRIVADSDFFLRLTRAGLVFHHMAVVVCSYDSYKGISVDNEVGRTQEYVKLLMNYGVPGDSPYIQKLLKDARFKQLTRRFLPSFVWARIRENKIRKEQNIKKEE